MLRFTEAREIVLRLLCRGHGLGSHGEIDLFLGGGRIGCRLEAVFVDELRELELHKERVEHI